MQLAKDVTRVRARHGRSHKTLVAKSHMKVDDADHGNYFIIDIYFFSGFLLTFIENKLKQPSNLAVLYEMILF